MREFVSLAFILYSRFTEQVLKRDKEFSDLFNTGDFDKLWEEINSTEFILFPPGQPPVKGYGKYCCKNVPIFLSH